MTASDVRIIDFFVQLYFTTVNLCFDLQSAEIWMSQKFFITRSRLIK